MPENARTPLVSGIVAALVGLLLALAGAGPLGVAMSYIGALLILVGAIAWGVWLALDQWERDRMDARWSRIRQDDEDGGAPSFSPEG